MSGGHVRRRAALLRGAPSSGSNFEDPNNSTLIEQQQHQHHQQPALSRSDDSIARDLESGLHISRKRTATTREELGLESVFDIVSHEDSFDSDARNGSHAFGRRRKRTRHGTGEDFEMLDSSDSQEVGADARSAVASADHPPVPAAAAAAATAGAGWRSKVSSVSTSGDFASAFLATCAHRAMFGPFPNMHPLETVVVTTRPAVLRLSLGGSGGRSDIGVPVGSVLRADGWGVYGGSSTRLFSVLDLADVAGTPHPLAAHNVGGGQARYESAVFSDGLLEPPAHLCAAKLRRCSECKGWIP